MAELKKEFGEIVSSRPAGDEDVGPLPRAACPATARAASRPAKPCSRPLPTSSATASPDDYFDTYTARMRALKPAQVNTAGEKLIKPEKMTWLIVGDRAKVEAAIRALNYGDLRIVDADGNPVK